MHLSMHLNMTNMYRATYMEKLKAVSGNVRSIDPFPSNKQELQQGSQGFPAHCLLLKPVWGSCSCRHFSFSLSPSLPPSLIYFLFFPTFFPSPPPFVLAISEGLSPLGKEGVIWSLRALIKTSVWLSGISCADVCVSVYFSVVLWLHDNLSPFSLSLSCIVSSFCSRCLTLSVFVFLRASMKHPAKTSECSGPSFCY